MKKKVLLAVGLGAAVGCVSAIAAGPVESLSGDNQSRLASALLKKTAPVAQVQAASEKGVVFSKAASNKLQAGLATLNRQNSLQPRSLAAKDLAIDFPMMRFSSGKGDVASVSLNLAAKRDAASLAAVLSSLGATNISTYGRMVGARVPVSALDALNASQELLLARPVMARTNRGIQRSQGDFTMRTRFIKPVGTLATGVGPGLVGGPTGLGVRVGVLSDSFACNPAPQVSGGITTFASNATQDLANNEFAPVTVLKELSAAAAPTTCADGADEGRAMIQLIADVAPDSTQGFYTAFDNEADFANGILALRNTFRADIVVDDVGYFDEPYFQDGIVAQAAQAVYDSGGMYFSSAGNSARLSYEAPFQLTSASFPSIDTTEGSVQTRYHNFGTAASPNATNNFRLSGGQELTLAFQWDQPYASATVGGAGSQSDLDIFLVNSAGTVVAAGFDANIGGDPFEILDYVRPGTGAAANYRVVVNVFSGPVPTRIKWVSISGQTPTTNGTSIGFNTNSPTATGHAAAVGAMSVGAAPYYNTLECGVAQTTMESFSSWGGTPILFAANGTRLTTPVTRQKPDITAPDGARTSFFISQFDATPAQRSIVSCQDPADGLANNFFGTSAAAPHAAGVAALLRQAAPQATNAQIYAAMRSSAADITVATANPGATPGFDFQSGFGYVRADAAYTALVDNVPDAFSFTALNNVPVSSVQTSNPITVTGINAPSAISVAGGSYSINGGTYVTTAGTVSLNDVVRVRQTSSSSFTTATTATLTIGGVSAGFTVTTEAQDTIPNAFSFTSQPAVPVSSVRTSNTITVTGINAPSPISITGGSYSINGGSYVTTDGTVSANDTVTVRQTSSPNFTTSTTATLTIGGVSAGFTVTTEAQDTTPNAFSFADVSNAPVSAKVTSNAVTITGINSPATVTISRQASYSINGGPFQLTSGTISNGDTLALRVSTSTSTTPVTATVTVGGVSTTWTVTVGTDTTPDAFTYGTVSNLVPGATTTTGNRTISGINAPASISVGEPGTLYSVNGGSFTASAGTVSLGDTVRLQATASTSYGATTTASVNVGGTIATLTLVTQAQDTTPDAFDFGTGVGRAGAVSTSSAVYVAGINAPAPISISGDASALYSVNGGPYTNAPGTVSRSQSVRVRLTIPATGSATAVVNIGGVTGTYSVSTPPN